MRTHQCRRRCSTVAITIAAAIGTTVMAFSPTLAHAQMGMGGGMGAASSTPSFGALIGTNFSTISEADKATRAVVGAAFDRKKRVGLKAGVFLNIPLAGAVSLQPEAHYSQQGVTYESTISAAAPKASVKIDYVEVPVLLRIDLGPKASMIHPILFGGASGAFRISCNVTSTSGSTSLTKACSENTTSTSKDPLKKYDASAIAGAGLAVNAMGRAYALTLRYTQGLSNISTDNSGSSPKNASFSVQLGLGF